YPGEQFQQATAHIRYRARHSRLCRRGRGSINDRLTHDEAPVAGICERTPVPTGASSHPPPGTPLMIRSQHTSTNRDSMPQNDLGTAVVPADWHFIARIPDVNDERVPVGHQPDAYDGHDCAVCPGP